MVVSPFDLGVVGHGLKLRRKAFISNRAVIPQNDLRVGDVFG